MSWPSLESWRQSLCDESCIAIVKPLNKKRTVWKVKHQGRTMVLKLSSCKTARYNQSVASNAFATMRRGDHKSMQVFVPDIIRPLGDATVQRSGDEAGQYNAFLMNYHCGDSLDILIDQLVEFRNETAMELVAELAATVEQVAKMLTELQRVPNGTCIPDLQDTLVDLESGQITLLDYDSNRTRDLARGVLFKWIQRLQELAGLWKLSPVDPLDPSAPPEEFGHYARLASAFRLNLLQASRSRMRKQLLGGNLKDLRYQQRHWNTASAFKPSSPALRHDEPLYDQRHEAPWQPGPTWGTALTPESEDARPRSPAQRQDAGNVRFEQRFAQPFAGPSHGAGFMPSPGAPPRAGTPRSPRQELFDYSDSFSDQDSDGTVLADRSRGGGSSGFSST